MIFKLLDNEKGVILSRSPELCVDCLVCEFENAPDGVTAIFEYAEGGVKYFKELWAGKCELPLGRVGSGTLTLTAAILDGSADPKRWLCEEICVRKLQDGTFLILPNDGDIPLEITHLKIDICNIRGDLSLLAKKYNDLADRLERIMEGYDLT